MKHKIVAQLQELTEKWKGQFDNPPDLPLIWGVRDERLVYLDDQFVTAADAIDPDDVNFDVELWHIGLTTGGCVEVVIDWPYEGAAKFSVVTNWGEIQTMDAKSMTTEELEAFMERQLDDENEDFRLFDCFTAMGELKRRKGELDTPEQRLRWKMTVGYYYPWSLREDEDLIDPSTGVKLTPSWHGQNCQGNGEHPGVECCCDECDHYQACFPETGKIWDETNERYI